jgi:hypothetical protein
MINAATAACTNQGVPWSDVAMAAVVGIVVVLFFWVISKSI